MIPGECLLNQLFGGGTKQNESWPLFRLPDSESLESWSDNLEGGPTVSGLTWKNR